MLYASSEFCEHMGKHFVSIDNYNNTKARVVSTSVHAPMQDYNMLFTVPNGEMASAYACGSQPSMHCITDCG